MKIRFVILNLYSVLLLSCGGDKPNTDASEAEQEQTTKITARAIEEFEYSDYVLSPEGETEVSNWEKYKELAIQIDYLKKADLSFFNGDKVVLKKFIDTLKIQIPDTLKTNSITSRATVVETTLLRLNENLTLDNIESNLKLESVKEVIVAFSNLNYQINNKLVRDKYEKIKSQY